MTFSSGASSLADWRRGKKGRIETRKVIFNEKGKRRRWSPCNSRKGGKGLERKEREVTFHAKKRIGPGVGTEVLE